MSNSMIFDVRRLGSQARHFFHEFHRELAACRECGDSTNLFDRICPHCGAGNPVRIPVSTSVVMVAVASQIAIILLRIC